MGFQPGTNGVNGAWINGGVYGSTTGSTTNPNPNVLTSGQSFTFVTPPLIAGGELLAGPSTQEKRFLEEQRKRRETPPFHWWSPDPSGHVCRICDFDNIYRGSKDDHMPIIFEEPDEEEWRDQL